jgi:hypothetical protein
MKTVTMVVLISFLAFSGGKKPVYVNRSVELAKMEATAKEIIAKRAEAQKFIEDLDKNMFVLQTRYSVYVTLPDSFIARVDTLKQ